MVITLKAEKELLVDSHFYDAKLVLVSTWYKKQTIN